MAYLRRNCTICGSAELPVEEGSPGTLPRVDLQSSVTSRASRTLHDRSSADIPDGVAIRLSEFHDTHASLSLEAKVTFRLDLVLIYICGLNAQLSDAQHMLRQAVEEHTDETAVLIQQVGELREVRIHCKYGSWKLD